MAIPNKLTTDGNGKSEALVSKATWDAQSKAEAAIRLEQLWDKIARTYETDILCGYPLSGFHRAENSHFFQRIYAEHSVVYS